MVEVHRKIKALRDSGRYVDKFSIFGSARFPLLVSYWRAILGFDDECGYSLGGLIVRVVVQRLFLESSVDCVQPCNFTTFASPAIGIPKYETILPVSK